MQEIINSKNKNQYDFKKRLSFFIFLLFLLFGLFFGIRSYNLVRNGIVSNGTIVDNKRNHTTCSSDDFGDSTCYTYAAIVEYINKEGDKDRFISSLGKPNPYTIGQEVKIIYNSDKPDDIEIYDFQSLWLFPILLVSFAFVGFLVVFFTRNAKFNNYNKAQVSVSMENGQPVVKATNPRGKDIAKEMQEMVDDNRDLIDKMSK